MDHKKLISEARTIRVVSNTAFITTDVLSRSLTLQKEWPKLNVSIVQDQRVADLALTVDRVIFTHLHTYSLVDTKTSIVLASGSVRALDGIFASDGIAEEVVNYFSSQKVAKAVGK